MPITKAYAEARALVEAMERSFAIVTLREDGWVSWEGPGYNLVSNPLWARSIRCPRGALKRFLRDTGRTPETQRSRLAAAYLKAFKSTGHLLGLRGSKIILIADETITRTRRQNERASDWWATTKEFSPEMHQALLIEVQQQLAKRKAAAVTAKAA